MKSEKKKYKEPKTPKRRRISNMVYLVSALLWFECIGMGLLVFPRSTESITEKRELKQFPELSADSYLSGEFTEGVSEWFSDTVPFRDELTDMSAQIKELKGFRQDGIRLHNVGSAQTSAPEESKPQTSAPEETSSPGKTSSPEETPQTVESPESRPAQTTAQTTSAPDIFDPDEEINPDDAVTITNNGIAVVGCGRALRGGGEQIQAGSAGRERLRDGDTDLLRILQPRGGARLLR